MKKFLSLIAALLFLAACRNPISSGGDGSRSLSVSWGSAASSRTIVPSSYPSPASYDVSILSGSTVVASRAGLGSASTGCSFSNLAAEAYTITVVGKDSSGTTLVTGSAAADLSSASSASPAVVLNYITSTAAATGTGQIHLSFALSGVSGVSATAVQVDPNGTSSSVALGGASPTFTYDVSAATVGTYKLFAKFTAGSQTAYACETILVAQGVSTTATVNLGASDFASAYVAVAGVSFSGAPSALSGDTTLNAAVSPADASNPLLIWNSSNTSVATVDQSGNVTMVEPGSATITARSMDNPAAVATQTIAFTASYGYVIKSALDSSVLASATCSYGDNLSLSGLSYTVPSGYKLLSYNTAADGGGATYSAASSIAITSSNQTLYARFGKIAAWTGIASSSSGQYCLASSSDSGLWRSADYGVNWTQVDTNTSWNSCAVSGDGSVMTAARMEGGTVYSCSSTFGAIVLSTNYGASWVNMGSLYPSEYDESWASIAIARNSTSSVYNILAGVDSSQLHGYTYSGGTMSYRGNSFIDGEDKMDAVAVSFDGTKYCAGTSNYSSGYLFYGTGSNMASCGCDPVSENYTSLVGLAVDTNSNFYAIDTDGLLQYASASDLTTWTTGSSLGVDHFAVSDNGSFMVYSSGSSVVFGSLSGSSFTPNYANGLSGTISSVTSNQDGTQLLACSESGIWRSTDSGSTWTEAQ